MSVGVTLTVTVAGLPATLSLLLSCRHTALDFISGAFFPCVRLLLTRVLGLLNQ